MSVAKTFLALTYLAVKSIYKYFFANSSPSSPKLQYKVCLDSRKELGVGEGVDIEKKMNSTTDDEAYASSSSSIASTS